MGTRDSFAVCCLRAASAAGGVELGAGSESRPVRCALVMAADGCDRVSLHTRALCTGQLAWRSLQQAPFFGWEVASVSYREMVMIGSQFIA